MLSVGNCLAPSPPARSFHEVELLDAGTDQNLADVVAHLEVEWGLEAQPRSKFERALDFFAKASQ